MAGLQKKVDEVKNVMVDNIEQVRQAILPGSTPAMRITSRTMKHHASSDCIRQQHHEYMAQQMGLKACVGRAGAGARGAHRESGGQDGQPQDAGGPLPQVRQCAVQQDLAPILPKHVFIMRAACGESMCTGDDYKCWRAGREWRCGARCGGSIRRCGSSLSSSFSSWCWSSSSASVSAVGPTASRIDAAPIGCLTIPTF